MIFSGLLLAMILAALDQSIVNTVLPRMAGDLGGLAHFSWVVTAFTLSWAIATQIRCKLGDMFGRRTFLVICILPFVVASALCGVARSMGQLLAVSSGIGGAVMALAFLLAMSLRGTTFSESSRGTSLEEPA